MWNQYSNLRNSTLTIMTKATPLIANKAPALANYCNEVIFCVGGKSMQQG